MLVHIPWKDAYFPLRDHQVVEYDSKGAFTRVRNASTNRINKCRVVHSKPYPNKTSKKSPSPKKPLPPPSPKKPLPPPSPKKPPPPERLSDLVGRNVTGIVHNTGPGYTALVVDGVDGIDPTRLGATLVSLARRSAQQHRPWWNVRTPRSWTLHVAGHGTLGPHVSLHSQHAHDVGKRVYLRVVDVMHFEEDSRWVALHLSGPLVDKASWVLHLSCAQEPLF